MPYTYTGGHGTSGAYSKENSKHLEAKRPGRKKPNFDLERSGIGIIAAV